MNICLKGYIDRNFGDDMMIRIAAYYLKEHTLWLNIPRDELFIPYMDTPNIKKLQDAPIDIKFDLNLTVTGSGFLTKQGKIAAYYFIKETLESIVKDANIPKAVIGCNIGPFSGKITEFFMKIKLNSYSLITVREQFSKKYLDTNIKKPYNALFPDIVFAMPDEWIPKVDKDNALGISVYRRMSESNFEYYNKICSIADTFIEQTGKKVLLFAFNIESENDLAAAYTVKHLMKHGDNAEIIAHTGNGDNIIYNLMRCSCIITARFHMLVMAIRLGIPFVPVSYSNKSVNILEDMGYRGRIFNIEEFNSEEILKSIQTATQIKIDEEYFEKARGHIRCLEKLKI